MLMTHSYREDLAADPRTQALAVRDLRKSFGSQIAVNHLNLDVPRGSIYGIVGPNGAGKTTMLTMACGLQRPDSGQSFIAGHNVWEEPIPAKQAMGLLMDGAPVFDRLTGAEYLHYLGALHKLERTESLRRAQELLDALSLSDAADKRIADYSAGMTKKILLAGAVLHNPEVLILDEPLEAVDPVSGRLIQQMLRAYASRGGTVILSSHVMELVESLCDSVAVIAGGRLHAIGALDDVCQGKSLQNRFVELVGGNANMGEGLTWLRRS